MIKENAVRFRPSNVVFYEVLDRCDLVDPVTVGMVSPSEVPEERNDWLVDLRSQTEGIHLCNGIQQVGVSGGEREVSDDRSGLQG